MSTQHWGPVLIIPDRSGTRDRCLENVSGCLENQCSSGRVSRTYFGTGVLDQKVPTNVLPVPCQKAMTTKVYSKTLVLRPTTRNARASSQSAIQPKLTGRRRARVTYRTHGHRRKARNKASWPRHRATTMLQCAGHEHDWMRGPADAQ
jgi:hypothetical protein